MYRAGYGILCSCETELEMVSASTENFNNTSDTISLSLSEVQLSFNTFSLLTAAYPDNELLPDDNKNTNTELYTNPLPEDTSTNLYSETSEIYDPLACYNKFLYHHRLQTRPSPQTVGSFLEYIQENYPMYYFSRDKRRVLGQNYHNVFRTTSNLFYKLF